jgi:capsule polysaccharide export protein KpsE/RkpR
LQSLQQIYGNENVRVRAVEARLANLKRELVKLGGTSADLPTPGNDSSSPPGENQDGLSYPPLRQLPRLAVPYANLYRTVKVQENVFELLTQQYEISRIQEAKDVPVVNIIDAPGIPEKKSFPPRLVVALVLSIIALVSAGALLIMAHQWRLVADDDPRRVLVMDIFQTMQAMKSQYFRLGRSRL